MLQVDDGHAARRIASPNQRNPFDGPLARANSNYTAFEKTALVFPRDRDASPAPLTRFVHDSFRALVMNPQFSCVGAKAAVQGGNYRFGLYDALGSEAATAGLASDLWTFVQDQPLFEDKFCTFVASFADPVTDEAAFERALWLQLQRLHEVDRPHHPWDPAVSDDPADPRFSFSFAETGFFVVGLHPSSSRHARRFAWPTLVFNLHAQFEALRSSGQFRRMQAAIRSREQALQGTINANLSDFGSASEARQYSGRPVPADWQCPFKAGRRGQ